MKITSRKTERKVGDEGVFDFNGVPFDEAVNTLYSYYGYGEDSCDSESDDGPEIVASGDEWPEDDGDWGEDACCDEGVYDEPVCVNHVKMDIDYFKDVYPISAENFPPAAPLSDVEIRQTVELVQRGIIAHSQFYDQLLSKEIVNRLADEMTKDLVVAPYVHK